MGANETRLPEFPDLGETSELILLDAEEDVRGVIPALLVNHVLKHEQSVMWVDGKNSVSAVQLAQIAPRDHLLGSVFVSRSFTPYKHMVTIEDLRGVMARQGEKQRGYQHPKFSKITDPVGLIVCTGVDAQYQGDPSGLDRGTTQPQDAFLRTIANVASISRDCNLPVLTTRTENNEFSRPIERAATRKLGCEMTSFGPRFSGDDVETLVYPVTDGMVQTTILYWKRVCEAQLIAASAQEQTANDTKPMQVV